MTQLPNITQLQRDNALRFYQWMDLRETIRQRRERGEPWPWTVDPILREYSFTNVMREYDRVSIWIGLHLIAPYADSPHLWQVLAVARQINWPSALLEIHGVLHRVARTGLRRDLLDEMRSTLDEYQARGNKVYTGAYMIHADSDPRTSDWWLNKNHYVISMVIGQLMNHTPPRSSLRDFTHWMSQFESWGGFMSYEIACDLRWARGWLDTAPDIYTWANPGPGAKRGLNRIYGYSLKQAWTEDNAVTAMRLLLDSTAFAEWAVDFPRPLEMRDIEHSLCEWDKYERVRNGEGKPRSKYHPPTGATSHDLSHSRPQREPRSPSSDNVVQFPRQRPRDHGA